MRSNCSAPIRWRVSSVSGVCSETWSACSSSSSSGMPDEREWWTIVHAEALAAARHRLPDAAPADDPERRVRQVAAEHVARVPRRPLARAHLALALRDAAGDGEQQRERDVRGRVGQHVGRVADRDAALLGRVEVDVVRADREVGDRLHARRGVEEGAVDLLGDRGQQRVGLLRVREQVLRRAVAWSIPTRRPRARPSADRARGRADRGSRKYVPQSGMMAVKVV